MAAPRKRVTLEEAIELALPADRERLLTEEEEQETDAQTAAYAHKLTESNDALLPEIDGCEIDG